MASHIWGKPVVTGRVVAAGLTIESSVAAGYTWLDVAEEIRVLNLLDGQFNKMEQRRAPGVLTQLGALTRSP